MSKGGAQEGDGVREEGDLDGVTSWTSSLPQLFFLRPSSSVHQHDGTAVYRQCDIFDVQVRRESRSPALSLNPQLT